MRIVIPAIHPKRLAFERTLRSESAAIIFVWM